MSKLEADNLLPDEQYLRYVTPFYLKLMNMNFLGYSNEEAVAFLRNFKNAYKELNDNVLIDMLNNQCWRPSKVASWSIALNNKGHLIPDLLKHINRAGVHHPEHVLNGLFVMQGKDIAEDLKRFVYQQIGYILDNDYWFDMDSYAIQDALNLLAYIDSID